MSNVSTLSNISERGSWKSIPISIGASGPKHNHLIQFEELGAYNVDSVDIESLQQSEENLKSTNKIKKTQRQKKRLKLKALLSTSKTNEAIASKELNKKAAKRKPKKKSTDSSKHKKAKTIANDVPEAPEDVIEIPAPDMSSWNNLYVPDPVLKGLGELGFVQPMPIQSQVLVGAIRDRRDILGAAETGSGKTLAFGIPLIHHILQDKAQQTVKEEEDNRKAAVPKILEEDQFNEEDYQDEDFDENVDMLDLDDEKDKEKALPALILAPTRELAMQVSNHLKKAAKYTDIRIVSVVGGMAQQKQVRLLKKEPDIVIATPGRLWEIMDSGHPYLSRIHKLRYLVIDEADRMLERGHFEDLTKLFQAINVKDSFKKRQNFVFSATLTTVHLGPDRPRLQSQGNKETKDTKLSKLMKKIGVRHKPLVVDLTTKKMTAEKLKEARIFCNDTEKDFYLYYFLKSFPGRTLVFTNSIDCIFRLSSLFELLDCQPLHIHAKMQQRQRLKNLERFHANPNGIMMASDVAARGLDIPDVSHVIHYQTPRTMETYIHRSGRSARSGKEGFSLLLIGPSEMNFYKRICRSLGKDEGMPQFVINESYMNAIRRRVNMAKEIDELAHKQKKIHLHNNWFSKTAEAMDVALDEDMMLDNSEKDERNQFIKAKRKELKSLLASPIFPKGFSGKYITETGGLQLPGLQHSARNVKKKQKRRR